MYNECPDIKHENGNRAYYEPFGDYINIPQITYFDNSEEYYHVLFHEMIHSTGHESRLNRFKDKIAAFRDEEYSKEELVAEIGSAYLSFDCGIDNIIIDNSVSYIHNWLSTLQDPANKKWLINAFSKAEKAVAYITQAKGGE